MPPKSQNQAVAMNLADAIQRGKVAPKPGTPSAEIAKSMPAAKMGEFTGPVSKSLPKTKAAAPAKKKLMPVKNVGKPVKKMRFM